MFCPSIFAGFIFLMDKSICTISKSWMGVSKNEFVLKVTDHYLAHCDTILCSLDVKDKVVIYVIDLVPRYQVHTNYYPTEKGLHISPSIIIWRQAWWKYWKWWIAEEAFAKVDPAWNLDLSDTQARRASSAWCHHQQSNVIAHQDG